MDPWKVLGIPRDSDIKDVKSAYRALAKVYHPDNISTGDAKEYSKIQEAYKSIESGMCVNVNPFIEKGTYVHTSAFTLRRV